MTGNNCMEFAYLTGTTCVPNRNCIYKFLCITKIDVFTPKNTVLERETVVICPQRCTANVVHTFRTRSCYVWLLQRLFLQHSRSSLTVWQAVAAVAVES